MVFSMMIRDTGALFENSVVGLNPGTEIDTVSSLFDVEFDTGFDVASGAVVIGNAEVPPVEAGYGGGIPITKGDVQLAGFRGRASGNGEFGLVETNALASITSDQRSYAVIAAPNSAQIPDQSLGPRSVGAFQAIVRVPTQEYSGSAESNQDADEKDNRLISFAATSEFADDPLRLEEPSVLKATPEGAQSKVSPEKGSNELDRKEGPTPVVVAKTDVNGRLEKIGDSGVENAKQMVPAQVMTTDRPAQIPVSDVAPKDVLASYEFQSTSRVSDNSARDSPMPRPTNKQSAPERAHGLHLSETGLAPVNRPSQTLAESGLATRVAVPAPVNEVSLPKNSENDVWVSFTPKNNESAAPQVQVRGYGSDVSTAAAVTNRMQDSPDLLPRDQQQVKEREIGATVRSEKRDAPQPDPMHGNGSQIPKLPALPADVPAHTFLAFNKEDQGAIGSVIAKHDADVDLSVTKANRGSDLVAMRAEPPRPVVHQLADAARTTAGGTIEVKLSPEELGRVKLSFVPSEAGLAVTILAERPETLDLIRRNIEVFAQDLRHQGHQNLTFQFGQDGSQGRRGATQDDRSEMNEKANYEQASYAESPPPLRTVLSGRLDLRI